MSGNTSISEDLESPKGLALSPSPPLSLFLSSHFLRRFLSQKHEQGDTQVVPHHWSEELMPEVGARGTCRSTITGPRPSHSTAMDTSTRRWQICLVGLEPQLSLGPPTLSSTPTPTRLFVQGPIFMSFSVSQRSNLLL